MNRVIDYGFILKFNEDDIKIIEQHEDRIIIQQLKYFYKMEKKKAGYIKALYLHHLLDFFKETHVDIQDIDLVHEKFLQDKVIVEISIVDGKKINFQKQVDEIFKLIIENKKELYEDLKGEYLTNLQNSKYKNK